MSDLRIIDLTDIVTETGSEEQKSKYFGQLTAFANFVLDAKEGGSRKLSYNDLVESMIALDDRVVEHEDGRPPDGYVVKYEKEEVDAALGDPDDKRPQARLMPYETDAVRNVAIVLRDSDGFIHVVTPDSDDISDKAATTEFVSGKLKSAMEAARAAQEAKAAAETATERANAAEIAAREAAAKAMEAAAGIFPIATYNSAGIIKPGDGLRIDNEGTLSVNIPIDHELIGDSGNPVENRIVTYEVNRLNRELNDKAPKHSPVLTGEPQATTAGEFDLSERIATTRFVQRGLAGKANVVNWCRYTMRKELWEGDGGDNECWYYSFNRDFPSVTYDIQVQPSKE